MKRLIFIFSILCCTQLYAQNTTTATSVADNTIYSNKSSLSNGSGNTMVTGRKSCANNHTRRALVKFSPAYLCAQQSVQIISAELQLCVKNVPSGGYPTDSVIVCIHRVTANWGEGGSVATSPGKGTAAQYPDATWSHRQYPFYTWASSGGDYVATASECTYVHDTDTPPYTIAFNGSGIVSDVQAWANGTNNYGWIIIGDESQNSTGVPFHTKEATNANYRPKLVVTYTCSNNESNLKSEEAVTEIVEGEVIFIDDIAVYPNPVQDVLSVALNTDAQSQLSLYTVAGDLVKTATAAGTVAEIDVAALAPGSYILVVRNQLGVFTKNVEKK